MSLPRTSSAVFPLGPPSESASITRLAVASDENGNTLDIARRLILARSDRRNVWCPSRPFPASALSTGTAPITVDMPTYGDLIQNLIFGFVLDLLLRTLLVNGN